MLATVAIVDDHRLFRQALTYLVHQWDDYELLFVAQNGSDLLDQLQRTDKTPDLALVDLNNPVLDGFETTALLRQRYPAIRVLIVTMSDRKEDVIQAIQRGAHGYLVKGSANELRQAMQEVMTNGYYFPISLTASSRDGQSTAENPLKAGGPVDKSGGGICSRYR